MAHRKKLAFLSSLVMFGGIAGGCDIDIEVGESETADESMSASAGESDPGETLDPEDTTEPGEDTLEPGEDTLEPGEDTFGPDVGDEPDPGSACDPLLQDCPAGEGCYSDGEGEYQCAPEGDGQIGDACEFADACAPGLLCTNEGCAALCEVGVPGGCIAGECVSLDGESDVGACIDEDGKDPADPEVCDEPNHVLVGDTCLPNCDPVLQDCRGETKCVFVSGPGEFACVPDGNGDGVQGEQCEFLDGCEIGFLCISGDNLPVDFPNACSALCDLSAGETCGGPELECTPWYEEGQTPPGYEDVGICSIPQ